MNRDLHKTRGLLFYIARFYERINNNNKSPFDYTDALNLIKNTAF